MVSNEASRARELQNARNQKYAYEQQRRDCEKKISENNSKISRLRTAKKTLGDIKARLEEAAKNQKSTAENEDTYYEWAGEKKTAAQDVYASGVPTEYTFYINSVDIVLDAIVAEETSLENQNLETLGIMGRLSSWINSLIGKIEQLCN